MCSTCCRCDVSGYASVVVGVTLVKCASFVVGVALVMCPQLL